MKRVLRRITAFTKYVWRVESTGRISQEAPYEGVLFIHHQLPHLPTDVLVFLAPPQSLLTLYIYSVDLVPPWFRWERYNYLVVVWKLVHPHTRINATDLSYGQEDIYSI